jgi:NAD-dependent dihydropyrimidine dehydrogenase PreA subunit
VVHEDRGAGLTPPYLSEFLLILPEFCLKAYVAELISRSSRIHCRFPPSSDSKGSSDMTYVVALPCVDLLDRTCVDECPVDCIYEGERMMYIHPDECVDCGACEPVCPVDAISFEADVPPQWQVFYQVNVEFFHNIGSPGGASGVGKIHMDHPIVASLQRQR